MDQPQHSSLKGNFLIAMPMLADPNFHRSVTCISEHTEEGAVGIVINRVEEGLNGKLIFEELGIEFGAHADAIPIHVGGPVHVDELFVLHGPPLDWENSLIINDNLAMSNTRAILEAIARGAGPSSFLISLGCAGWGPGQLEWELSQNAWLTTDYLPDILFELPVESRWEASIRALGIDPDQLTDMAGHA